MTEGRYVIEGHAYRFLKCKMVKIERELPMFHARVRRISLRGPPGRVNIFIFFGSLFVLGWCCCCFLSHKLRKILLIPSKQNEQRKENQSKHTSAAVFVAGGGRGRQSSVSRQTSIHSGHFFCGFLLYASQTLEGVCLNY